MGHLPVNKVSKLRCYDLGMPYYVALSRLVSILRRDFGDRSKDGEATELRHAKSKITGFSPFQELELCMNLLSFQ